MSEGAVKVDDARIKMKRREGFRDLRHEML